MTPLPLVIECIETTPGFAALEDEWRRLFARTGSHLPFWTFDWSASWWRHFQRNRLSVADALRTYVVREPGGALVAVAPMMLTERPAVGFLRARSLQFFGADPNMTELKGVICTAADAERVHRALLQHLEERDSEWDWLEWSGLNDDCSHLVAHRTDVQWRRQVPDYLLALPDTWEEMKRGLKRNLRESVRKCYNSLKRDGHEFEFEVAQEPAHVAAALADLFRLHSARACLAGATAHGDVFATAHSRRFLLEVCERLARRDHWRAFTLRIGGRAVAIRLGFRFGDALYLYYSGFDPAWGRYSVMTTAVVEAIKHAVATGIRTVNLSTGKDVSKTRWNPVEVNYLDVTLCPARVRSELARRVYRYGFEIRNYPALQNWVSSRA
jgi:CelD/BcsL family acetyltransferase involved in cellulose biosynthesis